MKLQQQITTLAALILSILLLCLAVRGKLVEQGALKFILAFFGTVGLGTTAYLAKDLGEQELEDFYQREEAKEIYSTQRRKEREMEAAIALQQRHNELMLQSAESFYSATNQSPVTSHQSPVTNQPSLFNPSTVNSPDNTGLSSQQSPIIGQDSSTNTPHFPMTGQDSSTNLPHFPMTGQDSSTNLPHFPMTGQDSSTNTPHLSQSSLTSEGTIDGTNPNQNSFSSHLSTNTDEKAAQRILDTIVNTDRSTILAAATGTGKSVSFAYVLTRFFQHYPQAQCWAIAQKRDSFCGLDRKGRVQLFDPENPESAFTALDAVWNILQQRRQTKEQDRTPFKTQPVRLILADWHSIYQFSKTEDWFSQAIKRLSMIITVGREFNVCLIVDSQSYNISALGLTSDRNIRKNVNILSLGYTWTDENGNIQGDYGVIQNMLSDQNIIEDEDTRQRLRTEFKQLKPLSKQLQRPIIFTAVEPARLGILPDLRDYKTSPLIDPKKIDPDYLERVYRLEFDITDPSQEIIDSSQDITASQSSQPPPDQDCDNCDTAQSSGETSQIDPITCPFCSSQHIVNNGSYQGKKRLKCKTCGKSFFAAS